MSDFPRDSSFYHATSHFLYQKNERNIPGGAIRECIENGDVSGEKRGNGDAGFRLEAEFGGAHYWVAILPSEKEVKSCGILG